ncbi:hypothetical protein [Parvibaculum sp.]|jgi:uncharacterized membrane protein|uniref:hypothetical protein n=1 Tax=Parvibaculum sp. TaxID=2024848 RepID=UPI003C7334E3
MTMPVTLALLAASVACAAFLAWLERRPVEPGRVRLLPTTPLIFVSIFVALLMLVHVVNLLGFRTGG